MNILGISCYFHDSSACLLQDGIITAAASEERFNRQKHSAVFPIEAINFCLRRGGITVNELDCIVFHEKPFLKFYRFLKSVISSFPHSYAAFSRVVPEYLGEKLLFPIRLEEELGYTGEVLFSRHHISHAAGAFLSSPFEKSIIITCDGVGEEVTFSTGTGEGNDIRMEREMKHPRSIGLLYSALTTYLGFQANSGEGKVMALADYGEPEFIKEFDEIVKVFPDGSIDINMDYFDFDSGNRMFTKKFEKKFRPQRKNEELEPFHFNMAATLQRIAENSVLSAVRDSVRRTKLKNLCLSGGVFLNCVMNSKILEETEVENIFVFPAAGDSGCAAGAALFVDNTLMVNERKYVMRSAALGPEFSDDVIRRILLNRKISFHEMTDSEIAAQTASRIASGKVTGFFQGRMEFGPRALGNRSILADPRLPGMKDHLNRNVKHREWFRPYGVSVLQDRMADFFDRSFKNQFMLLTAQVLMQKREVIPSAVHVNGSCRVQTVSSEDGIFHDVIKKFDSFTGIPMVINTSFNDNHEPVVCTPEDAIDCYLGTEIDVLIINRFLLEKKLH